MHDSACLDVAWTRLLDKYHLIRVHCKGNLSGKTFYLKKRERIIKFIGNYGKILWINTRKLQESQRNHTVASTDFSRYSRIQLLFIVIFKVFILFLSINHFDCFIFAIVTRVVKSRCLFIGHAVKVNWLVLIRFGSS